VTEQAAAQGREGDAERTAARAHLIALQRRVWPLTRTPRELQALDSAEIAASMRKLYAGANYSRADQRQAVTDDLETFLDRLGGSELGYELAGTDEIVERLSRRIDDALESFGLSETARPVLGTARTGQVSARSFAVPGCAVPVVLIDVDLLCWIHILTSNLVELLPRDGVNADYTTFSTDTDSIERQLRSHPDVAARVTIAAMTYAIGGDPAVTMLSPAVDTEPLASILRDAVELFVVAHEVSHSLCGHLTGPGVDLEFDFIRDQELQADAKGLELSIRALQLTAMPVPIAVLGGELFFVLLELVEHIVRLVASDDPDPHTVMAMPISDTESHPSPQSRRAILRDVTRRSAPSLAADLERVYATTDALLAALVLGAAATVSTIRTMNADDARRHSREVWS